MKTRTLILLALPFFAADVRAQTPPPAPAVPAAPAKVEATAPPREGAYDLEVGFRVASVSGSVNMYRTQINERGGLLLRSFTFLAPGVASERLFDRLRVDASDLGAGPAGSLRIEADKADLYRLRIGYRHTNAVSALPRFANGQHSYDRTRNGVDVDLELLRDKRVTPFAGYSIHRLSGPGTSTYGFGGDEFLLSESLKETEHELRVGAGFNLGAVQGVVTQGWRRVSSSQILTLASSGGDGNNSDPLLGRPVSASGIRRDDRTRVSTPFTNIYLTGQVVERVTLVGNFVRFAADARDDGSESASGSFVSFGLSRFLSGLTEQASATARNTTWRGGVRAEISMWDGMTGFAGYQKEHRDIEGSALIDTIFLQTITFGGVDPRDVQTALNAQSSLSRGEDVLHAGVSARTLGPFAVRVELREARQNVTVAPDLAEIVVPGNQDGDFKRDIRTLDANVTYTLSALTLGAAWRVDRADDAIFRTDYRDRDRLRLRAAWQAPKWVRAGVTAERTNQTNTQTGIDLSGTSRQYSGDVEVTPREGIAIRGSLTQFKADNSILYRRPETFATDRSFYSENGVAREAGVSVRRAKASFDAGIARFTNRNDNPFVINRLHIAAGYELPDRTKSGVLIEYALDKYGERDTSSADFHATRIGIFLRYHP